MPIEAIITDAGRAKLVDARAGTTAALEIDRIAMTDRQFVKAPTLLAIPDPVAMLDLSAGSAPDPYTLHLAANDTSEAAYEVRGLGVYLADGTLFAIYSQADPIFIKTAGIAFLFAFDLQFQQALDEAVTFGDVAFGYPLASETVPGVAELASEEEVAQGADRRRIVTPAALKALLDSLFGALDYAEAEAFTDLLARTITGTGLATGGGTLEQSHEIDVPAAAANDVAAGDSSSLVVTPASLAGRAWAGQGLAKGSGNLTEDILIDVPAATGAEVEAGTLSSRAITPAALGAMAKSLLPDGHCALPGGLYLQWVDSAADEDRTITFPRAFPNYCLRAVVCSRINDGVVGRSGVLFHVEGDPTPTQVKIRREVVGFDELSTAVTVFAIGK